MTDQATAPVTPSPTLARHGRWCLAAGVVGVVQAAVVLAWPAQVDETRYSFPFTAAGYVVAQATFFLQHLPLALAVGALAAVPAVRRNRAVRGGLLTAAFGLVLLAVAEIVAMLAADVALDSTTAMTVSSVYGLPTVLAGAGLTVAGIVGLRHPGTLPVSGWLVLALGLTVFVVLTPALASGGFVAGRLAIMVWMALFALLGWQLQRSPARDLEL